MTYFIFAGLRENAAVWRFSAMIADLLIDNTKDDFTTKMKNGADIRIVKYAIDNKSYYMATNLIDAEHFPISYIKENYGHRLRQRRNRLGVTPNRWTVEEYLRLRRNMLNRPCH